MAMSVVGECILNRNASLIAGCIYYVMFMSAITFTCAYTLKVLRSLTQTLINYVHILEKNSGIQKQLNYILSFSEKNL